MAGHLKRRHPKADEVTSAATVLQELPRLELKERAQLIADYLSRVLPTDAGERNASMLSMLRTRRAPARQPRSRPCRRSAARVVDRRQSMGLAKLHSRQLISAYRLLEKRRVRLSLLCFLARRSDEMSARTNLFRIHLFSAPLQPSPNGVRDRHPCGLHAPRYRRHARGSVLLYCVHCHPFECTPLFGRSAPSRSS